MPRIHLTTFIAAPVERTFDACRSIDLHRKSMAHTSEEAVAGTVTGLIGPGETVTWKARHLWKTRFLRSKITAFNRPLFFTDEMVTGDFKLLKHEHHFKPAENGTLMIDLLDFETPYGMAGRLLNRLYLFNYLRNLLIARNRVLKEFAESDQLLG